MDIKTQTSLNHSLSEPKSIEGNVAPIIVITKHSDQAWTYYLWNGTDYCYELYNQKLEVEL